MKLHLIRHGKTQGSEQRLYYGKTDLPVSDNGFADLQQRRQQGGYPSLEGLTVYTTPLQRTEQTLHTLYGTVDHQILTGFEEINFGIFEMKHYKAIKDDPIYQSWITGDFYANVPPEGESFHQFGQRVLAQFQLLIEANQSALVIAHAGVISVIMGHLFPEDDKHHYAWSPEPGEGYTITFGDEIQYTAIPN